MFPSKYTSQRNKKLECFEKLKRGTNAKKYYEEKEEGSADEDDADDEDEDHDSDNARLMQMWEENDELDEDMMEDGFLNNPNMKVNIIFTVADNHNGAYFDDEYSEEGDAEGEEEEEDEDREEKENKKVVKKKKIVKKTKKNKNNYKKDDTIEMKIKNKWLQGKIMKENDDGTYKIRDNQKKIYSKISDKDIRHRDLDLDELKMLIEAKKNNGKRGLMKKLDELVKAQEKKDAKKLKEEEKKQKITNVKLYKKLMHTPNVMCDYKYFRNLPVSKQKIILEQMKDIKKHYQLKKPYRINLLETDMPVEYKVVAFNKINTLAYMDSASGEYYKIKQWVDTFMQIPFGNISHYLSRWRMAKKNVKHLWKRRRNN